MSNSSEVDVAPSRAGDAGLGGATAPGLLAAVDLLRADMLALEARAGEALQVLTGDRLASARNLVHYLALRRRDLRPLQVALAARGLSSLGRCEGHVLATVEAVGRALAALGDGAPPRPSREPPLDVEAAGALLEARTRALLGPDPPGRRTRIVATMGAESSPMDVQAVVSAGADLVRVNCAHDDPATWTRLADDARRAGAARGRPVRVLMDLGGPKLRTVEPPPGPRVVTWRVRRDALGAVVAPARVWLHPEGDSGPAPRGCDAALPVPGAWLDEVAAGDTIRLVDTRGRRRALEVVEAPGAGGRIATCDRRAFVVPGLALTVGRGAASRRARVGQVPATRGRVDVAPGEALLLVAGPVVGGPRRPARIGCTLPAAVRALRPGQRVVFDDGAVVAAVEAFDDEGAHLRVLEARPGVALVGDKGINLPDLALDPPGLTERDERDLQVAAGLADVIGLSFVSRPEDVTVAAGALAARGRDDAGLLLKIETRRAFAAAPRLLLAALRQPRAGVMIARGDLAVEIGFERLAEVQEELLWLCEAAHLPAVWATQVLEQMTKRGVASRAEITDAAAGERAEAVMLNKGRHQARAVACLSDVLGRMQGHQHKKSALLRPLGLALADLA